MDKAEEFKQNNDNAKRENIGRVSKVWNELERFENKLSRWMQIDQSCDALAI